MLWSELDVLRVPSGTGSERNFFEFWLRSRILILIYLFERIRELGTNFDTKLHIRYITEYLTKFKDCISKFKIFESIRLTFVGLKIFKTYAFSVNQLKEKFCNISFNIWLYYWWRDKIILSLNIWESDHKSSAWLI